MSRNLVSESTAEANRTGTPGGYTFNAEVPDDYEGVLFVIAALRLGDHAHLDIYTGRQVAKPEGAIHPTRHLGAAGRLILRWHEWLIARDLLDVEGVPVLVREVENPSEGNLRIHAGGRNE